MTRASSGTKIMQKKIETIAHEEGFDACGFAQAGRSAHAEYFENWLARGYHGSMDWLARNIARRTNPQEVLLGAKTLIMCAVNYFQYNLSPEILRDPSRGIFARYAWFDDYHETVGQALERVVERMERHDVEEGRQHRYKWYVDTGPVLEREWGEQAGLGFVGKNTMLIRPGLGSYFFIGVILTDLELTGDTNISENDSPQSAIPVAHTQVKEKKAGCFSCQRCINACPTGAIEGPRVLNANKCISYLTIENKGSIPEQFRRLIGNRIYGCDICQEVCPWNKSFARKTNTMFTVNPDQVAPKLLDLMALTEEEFHARFQKSPVKRIKRRGFLRNVAVALGNWGSTEALPVLQKAVGDPEPLIREHAAWAVDQILRKSV